MARSVHGGLFVTIANHSILFRKCKFLDNPAIRLIKTDEAFQSLGLLEASTGLPDSERSTISRMKASKAGLSSDSFPGQMVIQ